jgi:hypothetical protein
MATVTVDAAGACLGGGVTATAGACLGGGVTATAGAALAGTGLLATSDGWQSVLAVSGVHNPILTHSPVIPERILRLDASKA